MGEAVRKLEQTTVNADVLIIGGGLAGSMAAIRARQMGASVVVAEKADTRRSGCAATGVDHCWTYIPEIHASQLSLEDLIRDHTAHAEGFVDQKIAAFIASHSFQRLLDLERFGVPIRDEEGRFRLVKKIHRVPTFLHFAGRDIKRQLTKQVRLTGARIMNRVMVTELLVQEGRVCGALGVRTREYGVVVFLAKAVVMATGNIYRLYMNRTGLPFNLSFPPHETGDGHAMAYRAGADLLNMEFTTFQTGPKNFQRCGRGTWVPGQVVDAYGKPLAEAPPPTERQTMDPEVENSHAFERVLRSGRGPIYMDVRQATDEELEEIFWGLRNEGNTALLDYLEQQGFDPRRDRLEFEVYEPKGGSGKAGIAINTRCESSLPGLYAAGDVIGGVTRAVSPGALTLGWQAGEMAALFARELASPRPDDGHRETIRERQALWEGMLAPSRLAGWREAQAALQNIMDYYAGRIRSETMLEAGLSRLKRLKEDARSELGARNPHELWRCLEVLNLMEAAEMIILSAKARRESRCGPEHYRADYPYPDDENWYCNTLLRRSDGQVILGKRPFNHIY